MKSLSVFLTALCATGLAAAQTTQTSGPEQRIQSVFDALRQNSGLYIAITGTDRIGNASTPIGTNLYYQASGSIRNNGRLDIKVNLVDYASPSGTPVATIETVADGRTLWRYDRVLHTYSATPYDVYIPDAPKVQSPTYLRDLLSGLYQAASGSGRSSYAARMLRELYGDPSAAQYRSWLPGRTPYETASYHDPINNVDIAQPNCTYEVYGGDPRRSIAFEIYTDPNTNQDSLSRVYITELSSYGGRRRVISYTLAPLATSDFSGARFTPYTHDELRGWRPTVAPGAVRG